MSIRELAEYITWLFIPLVCIAAGSGLIRFRQLSPPLRYLALLAGFDAFSELFSLLLSRVVHLKSNLFLFPIILTGEISLLALLYREALQSVAFTRTIFWVVGLFALYALLDQLIPHAAVHYAPGVQVVFYLVVLGMVGLYFRKLLNELHVEHLSKEPVFLFSVGLAVYALGTLLIALFSNYILKYCSIATQYLVLRVIRNFFNAELYVCYVVVLWMRPRK